MCGIGRATRTTTNRGMQLGTRPIYLRQPFGLGESEVAASTTDYIALGHVHQVVTEGKPDSFAEDWAAFQERAVRCSLSKFPSDQGARFR